MKINFSNTQCNLQYDQRYQKNEQLNMQQWRSRQPLQNSWKTAPSYFQNYKVYFVSKNSDVYLCKKVNKQIPDNDGISEK